MGSRRCLKLFICARIAVVCLFLVSTILLNKHAPEALDDAHFTGIVRLMAVSFVFSLVSLWLAGRLPLQAVLSRLQVVWDILFVTALLVLTGGIASPYSFLYLLAIMSAGVLLSRRDALYTAALSVIFYGAMVDMQYYGMLTRFGLSKNAAQDIGDLVLLYNLFLHLVGFVLAALATGYLSERARISEDALRLTEINYEELQALHTTIVENLDSGLLTTTPTGEIRFFNPYLQRLSGLSQQEAYNRPLAALFPELVSSKQLINHGCRGEFGYTDADGQECIIGYTASSYQDIQGKNAGIIVTLKDLTRLKEMEKALQRADRMAAVGELSARMAHEIRNPLTAISGSVQLLSQHQGISQNEARLLNIVNRETERLDNLLADFLTYARPRQPNFESTRLKPLLAEMKEFLISDQRFFGLEIMLSHSSDPAVMVDKSQIRQVLFNLLHNAADVTAAGGKITITTETGVMKDGGRPCLNIVVSDQGHGLDNTAMQHLFEPFWTTKSTGSGLGLAIVYRIIENHGGQILVESVKSEGSRFVVQLPLAEV
ncbi:MAG: ATP-binding protein [Desulfomicrobium sp.]|nr:ATP-binding protein [Desulfomicrobium sp.]